MPDRTRILFVDDEQNVLDGLQNLLRKRRQEWDMAFASSGDQALAIMAQRPFDVVVTDMRMPGMDGAALLTVVQARYPTVARIVLSGQAQREAVMRAVPVAHQYLSKPCDADQLKSLINQVCALQCLLGDTHVRRLVGQLAHVPSLPRSYRDLVTAANDPNVTTARLVAVVEQDPVIAAKVLQLVNSAYFGLPHHTASIFEAVRYIGVELLKALALMTGVFTPSAKADAGYDALQQHSLLTAHIARAILGGEGRGEEAFTAGVVHEIGMIVLARGFPSEVREVDRRVREDGHTRIEAERAIFGCDHARVGGYLLGLWGLPIAIVEAVAYCHTPGAAEAQGNDLIAVLHVADALAASAARGLDDDGDLDLAFLERAGRLEGLPAWRAAASSVLGALDMVA
ncbi:MAG: HDOD domain-containing protein [Vicinamibacterales bacterium]